MRFTRRTRAALAAVVTATALAGGAAAASYGYPAGETTESHTIVPAPGSGFVPLTLGPGSPRVVRRLGTANQLAGRGGRRSSLTYFAQLTDFQLADEESPARVEFLDPPTNEATQAAWRPYEAMQPWAIDWSFRQLNRFTGASPVTQAGGRRARMDLGLLTGDQSDNQERNETIWVRELVEGGQVLDPNSGVGPDAMGHYPGTTCTPAEEAALQAKWPGAGGVAAEAAKYTGVQDYGDYFVDQDFYDPNNPQGSKWSGWPKYTGLMDRAQKPFIPVGLRRGSQPVPTYATNGNHDGLVQGNEQAIKAFEDRAIGCFKPFGPVPAGLPPSGDGPPASPIITTTTGFFVPPDVQRQFVDRIQLKQIYEGGIQANGHGFKLVDPAEQSASHGVATYYAWDPKPGLRFINIDTVSEGGVAGDSSSGNIDDPQWQWLQRQIVDAERAGKLIVVIGHHPIRSLTAHVPDEEASPCSANDAHGHDENPGCDRDPRNSQPLHVGADLVQLLSSHHRVVAYVAGHTHENKVLACGQPTGCPSGGNWWEITTSATADWPQQHRLVELMDNHDGTLSIFGTTLDHGSAIGIPASNSSASGFSDETLASIARNMSWNDPQGLHGHEGTVQDRNVELLVDDPRTKVIRGTAGNDVIQGTPGPDIILCGAGNDVVYAGGGDDIVRCGSGNDRVYGQAGNDRISGDSGNDRLYGGTGRDRLYGRSGRDRAFGQSGRDRAYGGSGRDRLAGGAGRDRLGGGPGRDRVAGGSGADRMRGNGSRDRMLGGAGRDRMVGGAGNDRMVGGSGNDRMFGGSGNDRLAGGRGRDRLYGGRGRDRLRGGPGRDRLFGGRGRDRYFR
ncbi:MAG: hypothetical protein ABR581_04255 [Thermoleophilaceae bacterium]